jgi:tRNA dimethylallyltransferase
MEAKLPLIVIVGPTASGKTSLAIDLARKFNGEIICADSRTIYKGMDIGTAKPTKEEQAIVPHWGLDLVEPGERFTAADFKKYADEKIEEIRSRGHIPFLVGGTGLYVDAVLFDYRFGGDVNMKQRAQLEKMSIEELHNYCFKNNIKLPENRLNKRYVIRAIEQKSINVKRRQEPLSESIIVGIATNKDILRTRIVSRTEQLFENGVVEEAIILGKKYGWDSEAMTGNIYPLVRLYLNNELTLEEIKEKFTTLDWRLAKRQLTWLRRDLYIDWRSLDEAKIYLESKLANE